MTSPLTATQMAALADTDLEALRVQVYQERVRRATLDTAQQQADDLSQRVADAQGYTEGEDWRAPSVTLVGYPAGAIVTYNGSQWQSTVGGNVWQPGVANWQPYAPPGTIAAWIQPTGSTDAYALGAQVTHNGHTWTSLVAANVWEPTAANSTLWTDNGVTV